MKLLIVIPLLLIAIFSSAQKKDIKDQVEIIKLESDLNKEKINNIELKITNLQKEIDDLKKILQELTTKLNSFQQSNSSQISIQKEANNLSSSNLKEDKTKTSSQQTSSQSYGQCRATTKKGTRCSRSAKSNGYCWQHGG